MYCWGQFEAVQSGSTLLRLKSSKGRLLSSLTSFLVAQTLSLISWGGAHYTIPSEASLGHFWQHGTLQTEELEKTPEPCPVPVSGSTLLQLKPLKGRLLFSLASSLLAWTLSLISCGGSTVRSLILWGGSTVWSLILWGGSTVRSLISWGGSTVWSPWKLHSSIFHNMELFKWRRLLNLSNDSSAPNRPRTYKYSTAAPNRPRTYKYSTAAPNRPHTHLNIITVLISFVSILLLRSVSCSYHFTFPDRQFSPEYEGESLCVRWRWDKL